ncbi:MAG: RHS repeat-associated core domain-containing protein [Clostridia bacterium]|nr:RHS repeat-associated core domain-containing protein [Clostridia bacterium]
MKKFTAWVLSALMVFQIAPAFAIESVSQKSVVQTVYSDEHPLLVMENNVSFAMQVAGVDVETIGATYSVEATSAETADFDPVVYEEQQYLNSILGDRRNQGAIFDKSGNSYINSATGALHYSSTDLYLPGKAGLDVSVNRVYNSALQTISNEMGSDFDYTNNSSRYPINYKTNNEVVNEKYYQYIYTYYLENNTTQPIYVVFNSETEMLLAEDENHRISVLMNYSEYGQNNVSGMTILPESNPSLDSSSILYMYEDIQSSDANAVKLVRNTNLGAVCAEVSYETKVELMNVTDPAMGTSIGNGWRIQLPFAEWENKYLDGPINDRFYVGTAHFSTEKDDELYISYRQDADYGTVTYQKVTTYTNNGQVNVLNDWDVEFTDNFDSEYYRELPYCEYNAKVTDPEGTKRYYNLYDQRMVAIEDRFGNYITYNFSGDKLLNIVDTYGRSIRFNYNGDLLANITVGSVPYDQQTEEQGAFDENIIVTYETISENDAMVDPGNNLYTDNIYTLNVYRGTETSQDKTTYTHKLVQDLVEFGYSENATRADWKMLLTEVELSDNTKKVYEYDTSNVYFNYTEHETEKQKVSKTYYMFDGEKQMETTYAYNNPQEGKITNDEEYTHYTIIQSPNGIQKDIYDSKQRLTESRVLQDGILTKTNYTYESGAVNPNLITRTDLYQINATSVDAEVPENRLPYTTITSYTGGLDKIWSKRVAGYTETYTYGPYEQLKTHTVNGGTSNRAVNLTTTYTFSSDGKTPASMTVSGTDLRSRTQSYTYNADGTLASVTYDEDEGTTTYTYTYPELNTEANNLNDYSLIVNTATTGFRAVSDHTTSETYDMLGRAVRATDANGNTHTTTYNISGDVLSQTNLTLNSTSLYSYDYENNIIIATDSNGNRVKQIYDGLGRYTASYALDGETWVQMDEVTYDNRGRISTNKVFENTDGDYTKIEYTFNDGGKILEQKEFYNDELKAKQQYTYTLFDIASDDGTHTGTQIKTRTYKTNNQHFDVTQKYNELGFMTSQTTPDTGTTTYTYDKMGNVLSVADEKGTVATYTYNGVNQPRTVKDALGNTTTNYYDAYGNMYATQAPDGFIMNYAYNPRNELVSQAYDEGETTVWHNYWYDGNGNMIKEGYLTNPFGEANEVSYIHYTYDANNNVTKVSQNNKGDSTEVNYTYDKGGRMLTQTVGNTGEQSTTTYTYNFLNQPVTVTDALGDSVTYVYNLDGTVKSMTDRKGISTAYTYEGANRLTQKTAGNLTATYNYDMMNNRVGASITQNGTQQTSSAYTYNSLGWLTKEVTDGVTKNYTYDKRGNRLTFSMPNYSLSYVYDNANRLTTVKQGNNAISSYTYDVNNRLTKSVLGNGVTTDYTYNNAGWTTNVTASNDTDVLSNISYTYFTDGNVATKTEDGVTTAYTYDGVNRLKTETVGDIDMTYSYDSRGNRTALSVTGEESFTVINTFDKNNKQLTGSKMYTASEVEELTSYSYDENGNLMSEITETYTSKDGTTPTESELTADFWTPQQVPNVAHYEYDDFNRLVEFRGKGTEQATYTYTADGLRNSKTVNGKTTNQIWDGMNLVKDGIQNYYYGLDLISNNSQYYVHNAHGDVVHLTNSAGESVKHYEYDGFGVERNIDTNDTNPFRYCGEYYDAESDSIYLRARYYTPNTGRFTQKDTHWNLDNMIYGEKHKDVDSSFARIPDINSVLQSANVYVYALNNPITYVDVTGEEAYGTGISASAAFGIKLNIQIMFVWDDYGNKGIIVFGGVGAGTPNASVSGTIVINSADTIYDLEGMSISAGGSAGYVGGDFDTSKGGSVSGGVSVLPAELHADINFGKILWSW